MLLKCTSPARQRGFSLIEVLVALLITVVGSLGMIALQVRAQQSQLEAHQRSQALLLAEDMLNRLRANPIGAREQTCYVSYHEADYGTAPNYTDADYSDDGSFANDYGDAFYGVGVDTSGYNCSAAGVFSDQAEADVIAWDNMLDGATEDLGGTAVGGLIGARGCISTIDDDNGDLVYKVAVAYQGQNALSAPANKCAENQYGADSLRRVVVLETHFGLNE